VKTIAIIVISVGVSVAAVLSVLIGIDAYQQAQFEKQLEREYEQSVTELETIFEEIEKMPEKKPPPPTIDISQYCSGNAVCFAGYVTRIVDGDTIHVDGKSIRFTLASTPELGESGGIDAKQFVEQVCPVGTEAIVDEDDGQTEGSYGRIIAVVYCNGINLNEAVLDAGYGWLSSGFCSRSEFSTHAWAQKYGCGTPIQEVKPPQVTTEPTKTPQSNCDPSYPDVCIPPYPPDLNCGDISYRNFKVLQPDPHRFDGDKDGIGCEQ